jgi:Rad3-related DNA helicase
MYELHISSKKPTILVSPSMTEGIDLYDELSRFQIIVKVPFPYLGDNFIKTKMNRVPGWYEWETAKTIIQASGRSVRHDEDYTMTYILDSDMKFFYTKNHSYFPKWYRDAMIFV